MRLSASIFVGMQSTLEWNLTTFAHEETGNLRHRELEA